MEPCNSLSVNLERVCWITKNCETLEEYQDFQNLRHRMFLKEYFKIMDAIKPYESLGIQESFKSVNYHNIWHIKNGLSSVMTEVSWTCRFELKCDKKN